MNDAAHRAWEERWDELCDELARDVLDEYLALDAARTATVAHLRDAADRALQRVKVREKCETRPRLIEHALLGIERGYIETRTVSA